jgi:hypothetical protein
MTNELWMCFLVCRGDGLCVTRLRGKLSGPGFYELLLSRNQLAATLVTIASARMMAAQSWQP